MREWKTLAAAVVVLMAIAAGEAIAGGGGAIYSPRLPYPPPAGGGTLTYCKQIRQDYWCDIQTGLCKPGGTDQCEQWCFDNTGASVPNKSTTVEVKCAQYGNAGW